MKSFFERIRIPEKGVPLKIQMAATIGVILFGFALVKDFLERTYYE